MKLSHSALSILISTQWLMVGQAAWAQQTPSAGSQLLQIPVQPSVQSPKPDLRVESEDRQPAAASDSARVGVMSLQFSGASSIAEAELIGASGFAAGGDYTLAELRTMAAKVTSHYRSLGFFLAQTYLPAQDITEGVVRFTVVEGQYGQVNLRNQSGLSDAVAMIFLEGLKTANTVNQSGLERRLLILSDLPGIQVKSVLTPGTVFGSTDLLVDIMPGQSVSGSVEADNQGNSYTGSNRIGASINVNEPLGLGDVATARVLTTGQGLTYGRVSYQAQLGWFNVGLAQTNLQYKLGGEFASTGSSGSARVGSVYISYPLIRSRNRNLNAQWLLDNKDFSDRTEAISTGPGSEKNVRINSVGISGNFRDALGSAMGNYALHWTYGNVNLQEPTVLGTDSVSAQSHGTFEKVAFTFAGQQAIAADTGVLVSVNGQWASRNLDASEKFSLGGPAGVRAFSSGEATGDEGVLLALETRTGLTGLSESLSGQLQLVGFVDAGMVTLNKNPWDTAAGSNHRRLTGAGLGFSYVGANNLTVKAHYAFKLGGEAATSAPDSFGRFWLQMQRTF
jgi:hemolysin activation/secretion protein